MARLGGVLGAAGANVEAIGGRSREGMVASNSSTSAREGCDWE